MQNYNHGGHTPQVERVLARLDGVRHTSRGWLARCPAHDDRSPSLSIATGADGRVLVRCWAGCEPASIVAAIGLSMTDLFAARSEPLRRAMPRPVTKREIRAELRREAAAYRVAHKIHPSERLLAGELTTIRRRVALRYGVRLDPVPRPVWEGVFGGRERDRLWPVAFQRAWSDLWFERTGGPPPYALGERELRPAIRILVEDRAAEIFRSAVAR